MTSLFQSLLDAIKSAVRNPARVLTQGAAVAVGACLSVLALGLGHTVSGQIDQGFDITKATTLSAHPSEATSSGVNNRPIDLKSMVFAREIDGVVDAALFERCQDWRIGAKATPFIDRASLNKADVVFAEPSIFHSIDAQTTGRNFDAVDATHELKTAVVGYAFARENNLNIGSEVSVLDDDYMVVGVIQNVDRLPNLLSSIIIPLSSNNAPLRDNCKQNVIMKTKPGAGGVVSTNLAATLSPGNPDLLDLAIPPSPDDLRLKVSSQVRLLSLTAAGVVTLIGVFAVANLMLVSVMRRSGELGMRRALGASRANIVQFIIAEASVLGVAAGTVGSLVGVWSLLAICLYNKWEPILDPLAVALGVTIGLAGGLIGGLAPAIYAAKIQPAVALRSTH